MYRAESDTEKGGEHKRCPEEDFLLLLLPPNLLFTQWTRSRGISKSEENLLTRRPTERQGDFSLLFFRRKVVVVINCILLSIVHHHDHAHHLSWAASWAEKDSESPVMVTSHSFYLFSKPNDWSRSRSRRGKKVRDARSRPGFKFRCGRCHQEDALRQ
jgi:hypothetical protein